ncbi:MAG: hypothetical protein ABF242_04335 [Flavobacteriales bacterium]
MKKSLAIVILIFSSLFSFSQLEVEEKKETYQRGVIKVRKQSVEILIKTDYKSVTDKIVMPALNSTSANIIYESPCSNISWMRKNWKFKGFTSRAFNREYVIDAMEVEDCENVKLHYISKEGDTTTVESKMNFEEEDRERKVTFTYLKEGKEEQFFFDFSLKIQTELNEFLSTPDSNVYDTVSIAILLNSEQKYKKYSLVNEQKSSNHNFFPGICKEAHDTIQQWISDTKDAEGYRHKITFKSCREIEILYRNPLKKLRKEKIEIEQVEDENFIKLDRQRIDAPDKYFSSRYGIKFAENKLILSNKVETFTYSIVN